jgi:TatD DNase family protein
MVREHRDKFSTGVVHSFTGDEKELQECLELGLYIGVNGCSLKTEENVEIVKLIPLDRIMLETDCPYCEIRKSHAGSHHIKTTFSKKKKDKYEEGKMVKDRNEPCTMIQVLEVLSQILDKP